MIVLVSCGDNELPPGAPLARSGDVVIVAHQDDDLLFIEPDVIDAVRAGGGVTTIYVTAGNATHGTGQADKRYDGLESAYADAAGRSRSEWFCGWIQIDGHTAQHCRLDAAKLSLVFLAYPDGGVQGEYDHSLLKLWEGVIDGADTIALDTAHYDRDGLVETIADVLQLAQPATVHTLEVASTHGHDHSDHMIVGALAVLALARSGVPAELISYRGYDILDEPADKLGALYADDFAVLARYEACAAGCASCGQACTTIETDHMEWLGRRYAVGFRTMTGQIDASDGSGCAELDENSGLVVDSECAPTIFHFDASGTVRIATLAGARLCLQRTSDDRLIGAPCTGDASQHFYLDDEGHIWSAVPPVPQANMDFAHLDCMDVSPAGEGIVTLCGADHAPTWTVEPVQFAFTDRAKIGLASSGRAVRLADVTGDGKADLCAVESGALRCAPGNGDGTFGAAVAIDDPSAPLAIDPLSLAFGDIDGDGRPDACGRDANGVLCATAASGFRAARLSTALSDATATPATSRSFTIATSGGAPAPCAITTEGIACALAIGMTSIRSQAPDPTSTTWIADLDDDGEADWCVQTATGPTCGAWSERAVSLHEGMPWGFALGGNVEGSEPPALDTDNTALVDIDGDGRADLCSIRGANIVCARSQRHGFGPRASIGFAPSGADTTGLWFGDLRGDGGVAACTADATRVYCTL